MKLASALLNDNILYRQHVVNLVFFNSFYVQFYSIYDQSYHLTSLLAQLIKNLPAVQETQVRFLGQKDPLEKEMAAHSSILAWKIPWTGEPGGLQSTGSQSIGHD